MLSVTRSALPRERAILGHQPRALNQISDCADSRGKSPARSQWLHIATTIMSIHAHRNLIGEEIRNRTYVFTDLSVTNFVFLLI